MYQTYAPWERSLGSSKRPLGEGFGASTTYRWISALATYRAVASYKTKKERIAIVAAIVTAIVAAVSALSWNPFSGRFCSRISFRDRFDWELPARGKSAVCHIGHFSFSL